MDAFLATSNEPSVVFDNCPCTPSPKRLSPQRPSTPVAKNSSPSQSPSRRKLVFSTLKSSIKSLRKGRNACSSEEAVTPTDTGRRRSVSNIFASVSSRSQARSYERKAYPVIDRPMSLSPTKNLCQSNEQKTALPKRRKSLGDLLGSTGNKLSSKYNTVSQRGQQRPKLCEVLKSEIQQEQAESAIKTTLSLSKLPIPQSVEDAHCQPPVLTYAIQHAHGSESDLSAFGTRVGRIMQQELKQSIDDHKKAQSDSLMGTDSNTAMSGTHQAFEIEPLVHEVSVTTSTRIATPNPHPNIFVESSEAFLEHNGEHKTTKHDSCLHKARITSSTPDSCLNRAGTSVGPFDMPSFQETNTARVSPSSLPVVLKPTLPVDFLGDVLPNCAEESNSTNRGLTVLEGQRFFQFGEKAIPTKLELGVSCLEEQLALSKYTENIDPMFHDRLEARKGRYQDLWLDSFTTHKSNSHRIAESIKMTVVKMTKNRHMDSTFEDHILSSGGNNLDGMPKSFHVCGTSVLDEMEAWDSIIRGMNIKGRASSYRGIKSSPVRRKLCEMSPTYRVSEDRALEDSVDLRTPHEVTPGLSTARSAPNLDDGDVVEMVAMKATGFGNNDEEKALGYIIGQFTTSENIQGQLEATEKALGEILGGEVAGELEDRVLAELLRDVKTKFDSLSRSTKSVSDRAMKVLEEQKKYRAATTYLYEDPSDEVIGNGDNERRIENDMTVLTSEYVYSEDIEYDDSEGSTLVIEPFRNQTIIPAIENPEAKAADSAVPLDQQPPARSCGDETSRIGGKRRTFTPLYEVAKTAAEVADSAALLDKDDLYLGSPAEDPVRKASVHYIANGSESRESPRIIIQNSVVVEVVKVDERKVLLSAVESNAKECVDERDSRPNIQTSSIVEYNAEGFEDGEDPRLDTQNSISVEVTEVEEHEVSTPVTCYDSDRHDEGGRKPARLGAALPKSSNTNDLQDTFQDNKRDEKNSLVANPGSKGEFEKSIFITAKKRNPKDSRHLTSIPVGELSEDLKQSNPNVNHDGASMHYSKNRLDELDYSSTPHANYGEINVKSGRELFRSPGKKAQKNRWKKKLPEPFYLASDGPSESTATKDSVDGASPQGGKVLYYSRHTSGGPIEVIDGKENTGEKKFASKISPKKTPKKNPKKIHNGHPRPSYSPSRQSSGKINRCRESSTKKKAPGKFPKPSGHRSDACSNPIAREDSVGGTSPNSEGSPKKTSKAPRSRSGNRYNPNFGNDMDRKSPRGKRMAKHARNASRRTAFNPSESTAVRDDPRQSGKPQVKNDTLTNTLDNLNNLAVSNLHCPESRSSKSTPGKISVAFDLDGNPFQDVKGAIFEPSGEESSRHIIADDSSIPLIGRMEPVKDPSTGPTESQRVGNLVGVFQARGTISPNFKSGIPRPSTMPSITCWSRGLPVVQSARISGPWGTASSPSRASRLFAPGPIIQAPPDIDVPTSPVIRPHSSLSDTNTDSSLTFGEQLHRFKPPYSFEVAGTAVKESVYNEGTDPNHVNSIYG